MSSFSPKIILAAACALYACLALWMAVNSAPGADEGWFASPSYNLLHHGHMGTSVLDPHGYILRPELKGLEHHTYWVLPAHLLLQTAWYKVTGFGLLSMRTLSILWGILLLISVFVLGKRLTGNPAVAALTALLLSTDLLLTQYGASGRMDMMCLSLGFAAQAVYLSWRERNRAAALFVSHLLLACAAFTHPNAIFLMACLLLLMIQDAFASHRRGEGWGLEPRYLACIALPYLLGGAAYWLYIQQDPAAFQAQIASNSFGGGGRSYYLRHPLTGIGEEILRYRTYYGLTADANYFSSLKSIPLFVLFAGLLGALLSPRRNWLLATLALIPIIGLTFFNYKNAYYLIYAMPYLTLCAAQFYLEQWRTGIPLRRWAVAGLLAAMISINLAGEVRRGFQVRTLAQEYSEIVRLVTPLLPAEGRIMAGPQFAFLFGFDRTIQDDTMGFYSGKEYDVMVETRFTEEELENIRLQAPDIAAHRERLLTEQFTEIYHGRNTSAYRKISKTF